MPRASKEQTAFNKQTMTVAASRLFREKGLAGPKVGELAAAAGLTSGAYYSLFESHDELAALACAHAFAQSNRKWADQLARNENTEMLLGAYLDGYLSLEERHDVGGGCSASALCGDLARSGNETPVHADFILGLKGMIANFSGLLRASGIPHDRRHAVAGIATLVGALTLARATRSDRLSMEILSAARKSFVAKKRRRVRTQRVERP